VRARVYTYGHVWAAPPAPSSPDLRLSSLGGNCAIGVFADGDDLDFAYNTSTENGFATDNIRTYLFDWPDVRNLSLIRLRTGPSNIAVSILRPAPELLGHPIHLYVDSWQGPGALSNMSMTWTERGNLTGIVEVDPLSSLTVHSGNLTGDLAIGGGGRVYLNSVTFVGREKHMRLILSDGNRDYPQAYPVVCTYTPHDTTPHHTTLHDTAQHSTAHTHSHCRARTTPALWLYRPCAWSFLKCCAVLCCALCTGQMALRAASNG
jgi:hypothetical protein